MRSEPKPKNETEPDPVPAERLARARLGRRFMIGALLVFLAAGALDTFGSRTTEVTAEAGGYTLLVTYPSVTRPGLPIRWEIEVQHAGGFSEPVRLATTFDYLHLFDISNLEPDAISSTATTSQVIYAFDPPPGDTFRVSMDGNTEPDLHEVSDVTTGLVVNGRTVVQVVYSTKVVP